MALIPETFRSRARNCVEGRWPWPLFAHGPAGVGKTCAALVLLDHAGGFYFTAGGLAESAADAMHGRLLTPRERRPVSPQQFWEEVGGASLVVLDELGARERVSDHHYDCVKRLLDLREGRPLICLANDGPEELAQVYDDRVASRLAAGTLLSWHAPDRRLER